LERLVPDGIIWSALLFWENL